MLELVDQESLADEIEQAGAFEESIYASMIKIKKRCAVPLAQKKPTAVHQMVLKVPLIPWPHFEAR